jgi:hypothetical protein
MRSLYEEMDGGLRRCQTGKYHQNRRETLTIPGMKRVALSSRG